MKQHYRVIGIACIGNGIKRYQNIDVVVEVDKNDLVSARKNALEKALGARSKKAYWFSMPEIVPVDSVLI